MSESLNKNEEEIKAPVKRKRGRPPLNSINGKNSLDSGNLQVNRKMEKKLSMFSLFLLWISFLVTNLSC